MRVVLFFSLVLMLIFILITPAFSERVQFTGHLYCNTQSMQPTISCLDELIFEPVRISDEFMFGVIYRFRPDGDMLSTEIVHRLVGCLDRYGRPLSSDENKTCSTMIFKGDNNRFIETFDYQPRRHVGARVVAIRPLTNIDSPRWLSEPDEQYVDSICRVG